MYSRILVSVDDSEASRHALREAIGLASALSARLRIAHVVDMSWLPLGPEVAIDTAASSAARRSAGENTLAAANAAARELGFAAETLLVETETPTQHVADLIAREALAWGAELIVLGSHGGGSLQHLLRGRVAEQTERRWPGPILLIPAPGAAPAA